MTIINADLVEQMTEQMKTMVAMSNELRNQFKEIKALRAELSKVTTSRDAASREIKHLSSSYTNSLNQLDKVQRDNTKLRSKVEGLEILTQKQRGIPFDRLR
jgi:uncharacterized protein (DUF3084 family)